jgi:hypothetical protein
VTIETTHKGVLTDDPEGHEDITIELWDDGGFYITQKDRSIYVSVHTAPKLIKDIRALQKLSKVK